mgnify:CR=1 FL=1
MRKLSQALDIRIGLNRLQARHRKRALLHSVLVHKTSPGGAAKRTYPVGYILRIAFNHVLAPARLEGTSGAGTYCSVAEHGALERAAVVEAFGHIAVLQTASGHVGRIQLQERLVILLQPGCGFEMGMVGETGARLRELQRILLG